MDERCAIQRQPRIGTVPAMRRACPSIGFIQNRPVTDFRAVYV